MTSFQFAVRLSPETTEEVLKLAKANRKTPTNMLRDLVQEAVIRRAEQSTDTQFHLVEKRLARLEERFVAWLVKLSKASAKGLFFTEQLALFEVEEEDQRRLQNAANVYVRTFLQRGGGIDEEADSGK